MFFRLEDGQEVFWSFEDWEKMCENFLVENGVSSVGVQLEGSGFDMVKNICFI